MKKSSSKMILNGNSLAERQHDLNTKVNDAAAKKTPLEDFEDVEGKSDINKLFQIDLASKYKNIDYIIEVLKSGDELYISRAIKCLWLYETEYKSWINPSNLQEKVFPFMSSKMMKKFLVKIGTHVTDEDRAKNFYEFCLHTNFKHFAFNFLINTSVAFKADTITNNFSILDAIVGQKKEDVIYIIGNNFSLAEAYQKKRNSWHHFRHLYSVDAELYLSKWEEYFNSEVNTNSRLGVKMSKDIMIKYKHRVLNNVLVYYNILNFKIFLKYTTSEDAKTYATALIPETSDMFWSCSYRTLYKPILDMIPDKEKHHFFKKIYETKYPYSEYEMSRGFYDEAYYDLMTVDQRELWALRYIENPEISFLSEYEDKEYLWYRFVSYDKAISAIKEYVLVTPETDRRAEIVEILIECTRNQDHLKKMFEYYYERHVNEEKYIKERFIEKVIQRECIWEFNEKCWAAFNKLLHSIQLYNGEYVTPNAWGSPGGNRKILIPVLFYYVTNELELPEELKAFVNDIISVEENSIAAECISRMNDEKQRVIIYQYLKQISINKIKSRLYNEANFSDYYLHRYIDFIKRILICFKKTNEELPDVVNYIISVSKKVSNKPGHDSPIKQEKLPTFNDVIRRLKEDAREIPSCFEQIRTNRHYILSFLRKLKVYFQHDLSKDFLSYFSKLLSSDLKSNDDDDSQPLSGLPLLSVKKLNSIIHGIFLLSDESFIADFMMKYAPIELKINFKKMNKKELYIQKAICNFVYHSRHRVHNIEHIHLFIKGDYTNYCLPLLSNYATNLTKPQYQKFVIILLKAPSLMQRQGLKMAFECFNFDDLKNLILSTWHLSKNISMRRVIYIHLVENMINKRDYEKQRELFEILLTLTSQLNEKDHRDIFDILTNDNDFPEHFRRTFFKTSWNTVNKLPDDDNLNIERRISVIKNIDNNINFMDYFAVRDIIDDFIQNIKEYILQYYEDDDQDDDMQTLTKAKYILTTTLIVNLDDQHSQNHNTDLLRIIMNACFEMWDDFVLSDKGTTYHFSRSFCHKFICDLIDRHFHVKKKKYKPINRLFEFIAQNLLDNLPVHEIFPLTLRLQFLFMTNSILDTLSTTESNLDEYYLKTFTSLYAAEVAKIINGLIEKQQFNLILMKNISEMVESFAEVLNNSLIIKELHLADCSSSVSETSETSRSSRRTWVPWKVTHQLKQSRRPRLTKPKDLRPSVPVAYTHVVLACVAMELINHNTTELMLLALDRLPITKAVEEFIKNSNDFSVKAFFYLKQSESHFYSYIG